MRRLHEQGAQSAAAAKVTTVSDSNKGDGI